MNDEIINSMFRDLDRDYRGAIKKMRAAFDYQSQAGLSLTAKQKFFQKIALWFFSEFADGRPIVKPSELEFLELFRLMRAGDKGNLN